MQNSLVTAHFFCVCMCCCQVTSLTFNPLSYEFYEIVYRSVIPARVSLWYKFQREEMQKPQCSGQGLKMNLLPQTFLPIAGEWWVGGTSTTQTEWKTIEKYFDNLFCLFKVCVIRGNWICVNDLPLCYCSKRDFSCEGLSLFLYAVT